MCYGFLNSSDTRIPTLLSGSMRNTHQTLRGKMAQRSQLYWPSEIGPKTTGQLEGASTGIQKVLSWRPEWGSLNQALIVLGSMSLQKRYNNHAWSIFMAIDCSRLHNICIRKYRERCRPVACSPICYFWSQFPCSCW